MRCLNSKYIRIAGIVAAVLLLLVVIGGLVAVSKREALLQSALGKAKVKLKRDYQLELKVGSARFTGIATVALDNIAIVPQGKDSLLRIDHFEVSIKLLPLIFGTIKPDDVALRNGYLQLTDIKGVKNFDFLFKKKQDTTTTHTRADLSELANNLIKTVLYKIPDDLDMQNFRISYTRDSTSLALLTQKAVIDGGELKSTIKVNNGEAIWHFDGTVNASDKNIDIKWYADGKKVELPLIEKRYHARLNFDEMRIRLNDVTHSDGDTRVFSYWGVHNLMFHQARLSSSDIVIPDGSIDANIFVGTNFVSVDSSSTIHLKKLSAHPFVKYTLSPKKLYELKLNTGWQSAQDVFDALPQGTFESFEGIKVAGKLNYSLNFSLDSEKPDNLIFDSGLKKDGDFRIVMFGKTDLSKLNGPFVYTPYVKGKPVRTMTVGPQNPNYTPLASISPNLRNAVMTAEDPTFYQNHGFVEEAIRKSIATDIKEKAFKRGGSTISMQLVKNAFLSQQKTLSRKIEEIMIVWMLENNKIMTKNRMLEVYFNIIEWGNNVYGIAEAARYYFGKSPADLSLGESIYLASIVPSPRNGLYAFMPDGTLRASRINYFNSLGRLMVMQRLTQRDSTGYGFYDVRLREGLRREVAPLDSAEAEQLLNAPPDDAFIDITTPVVEPEKKPGLLQRIFGGGKKDTVAQSLEKQLKEQEKLRLQNIDTSGKTKKQIRQEKRGIKKEEKDRRKALEEKGLL